MVHSSPGRESNPRPRDRKVQPRTTRPQRTKFVSLAFFEIMGPSYIWVDHDLDLSGSLDVISHLTIRIPICHFLLVFHWTQVSISIRFREIWRYAYFGHDLDLSGSRDVISHVTIRIPIGHFLLVFHWTQVSICNGFQDNMPKHNVPIGTMLNRHCACAISRGM